MGRPHPLLMALAAGQPPALVDDHVRLLASSVEHHMAGLLWSSVSRGELDGPSRWKEALVARDLRTQVHHRRLWRRLAEVTGRLADIGVEVAVIKGVPAEYRWYDRMGERPCVDLDLLVHPDHVSRVREIVVALDPGHELRDSFQGIFDQGLYQSIDLQVGGIGVDVHLDLFKLGPRSRHPDRLWQHTVSVPCPDGGQVRVLDAELSLVHFLVHLNRDSFCWLLGYADIDRILTRSDLDWDIVERLLRDEGIQVLAASALSAVTATLGVPGAELLPCPPGWRAYLWQRLWRPSVRLQGNLGWVRYRHRPNWLPVFVDDGLPQALRWGRGQLTLSEPLVTHANPGRSGPWWWRLIRGRIGRVGQRRRAAAQLRRADSKTGNHGTTPSWGSD